MRPLRPETPAHLDVVMYHFVRPIAKSRWPGIKGLELAEFEAQLDFLQGTYHVLTPVEAVAVMRGDMRLSRPACLLTFDDGYRDHADHVAPRLEARGIRAAFFPPACAALDRRMLDVNRIHFILASGAEPAELGLAIDEAVGAAPGLPPPAEFRKRHHRAFGYDTADVIYVKRMLQHALPEDLRTRLAASLFARHVTADETAFAAELYCDAATLARMAEAGHAIGSHGDRHIWLNETDEAGQRADISNSLRLLDAVGVSRKDFLFCYPHGGHNETTLNILRALGCAAAFTTRPASAQPGSDGFLTIPRLDTNVFPPRAAAPPFQMTAP